MSKPAPIEATPPVGAIVIEHAVLPATGGTTSCANCGAPLTGKYCSGCGQRHHDHPVHDFGHFVSEAAEDLTHADSRLWQTLSALLFRPGFLTREFLDGRRARYLPPLRLYLVISVLFFVIVDLSSRLSAPPVVVVDYNGKSFDYQVMPGGGKATGADAVAHTPAPVSGAVARGLAAAAATPAGRQRLCAQSGNYIAQNGGWLASWAPRVTQSCLATAAQGGLERLTETFEHNLERAMFLLLPLVALAMKPFYRKPPRYYVEHLLFLLHYQVFLFVALGVSTLLQMITASAVVLDPADTALTIYAPIYGYLAMRRVYGQGRWLTLSKLCALGTVYLVLCGLVVTATISFSFLTM
ncbi:MAG TPA: DUF3667 domain-containing protein [Steroidobacteraceae bacterium]|nr:DUF3667 domain-containing protein [Steroidobacteraceae bacterium]